MKIFIVIFSKHYLEEFLLKNIIFYVNKMMRCKLMFVKLVPEIIEQPTQTMKSRKVETYGSLTIIVKCHFVVSWST